MNGTLITLIIKCKDGSKKRIPLENVSKIIPVDKIYRFPFLPVEGVIVYRNSIHPVIEAHTESGYGIIIKDRDNSVIVTSEIKEDKNV